jgi:hypothetical protein
MWWNSKEHHWYEPGSTLGDVVPGSVALYAQVETSGDALDHIRVGYQSQRNPETITESYWTPTVGWQTRLYPNEMD